MRLLGGLFLSLALWAQMEQGSLVGVITDPQRAPVAGAAVEFQSLATNVKRSTVTNASGEFNSLPLQPGRYSVTVRQAGFREKTAEVTLDVGQRLQLDFALELGAVSEQVSVAANAVAVETASSEIGQIRPAAEIRDLPLNTRNFTQLVQLAPGVLTGVAPALVGIAGMEEPSPTIAGGAPKEPVSRSRTGGTLSIRL